MWRTDRSMRGGAFRRRLGALLGLAACVPGSAPAEAVPRQVVAGPAAFGWVMLTRTKPPSTALLGFVVQSTGPSSVRVIAEICHASCTTVDETLAGTMVATGTTVTIRTTVPRLGTVDLTGRFADTSYGTQATCYVGWRGSLSKVESTSVDYHEVKWSGRVGTFAVRGLPSNACAVHHTAGVFALT